MRCAARVTPSGHADLAQGAVGGDAELDGLDMVVDVPCGQGAVGVRTARTAPLNVAMARARGFRRAITTHDPNSGGRPS